MGLQSRMVEEKSIAKGSLLRAVEGYFPYVDKEGKFHSELAQNDNNLGDLSFLLRAERYREDDIPFELGRLPEKYAQQECQHAIVMARNIMDIVKMLPESWRNWFFPDSARLFGTYTAFGERVLHQLRREERLHLKSLEAVSEVLVFTQKFQNLSRSGLQLLTKESELSAHQKDLFGMALLRAIQNYDHDIFSRVPLAENPVDRAELEILIGAFSRYEECPFVDITQVASLSMVSVHVLKYVYGRILAYNRGYNPDAELTNHFS